MRTPHSPKQSKSTGESWMGVTLISLIGVAAAALVALSGHGAIDTGEAPPVVPDYETSPVAAQTAAAQPAAAQVAQPAPAAPAAKDDEALRMFEVEHVSAF